MKNLSKFAIVAASALVVASSAHATYSNGDLLVGFDGNSTDYVYDLGKFANLTQGETWNVGSYFGLNNLGTDFGVVGASANAAATIYATSANSASTFNTGNDYQNAKANVSTINGSITAPNTGITTASTSTASWATMTDSTAPGNYFYNNYQNPNVAVGSTAYFYVGGPSAAVSADSYFTYNSTSGVLQFGQAVAAPEPTTYGILAGVGLLALALRRQFATA
jgi:hypothetical protein